VLSSLDLIVEAGEKLVVVGRNGAGKTTLLRILAAVDPIMKASDARFRHPGRLLLQDIAETMSGGQSVMEALEADAPWTSSRNSATWRAPSVPGRRRAQVGVVLSGGEKSRLALLKLLLHR
jgi:ATP-binding cassette subfamily F protein 3